MVAGRALRRFPAARDVPETKQAHEEGPRLGTGILSVQLPPAALAQIALRCGTVHSSTLFTGYVPRRIRGEMFNYQVLPSQ